MKIVLDTDVVKNKIQDKVDLAKARVKAAKANASLEQPATKIRAGTSKAVDHVLNNWADYALAATAVVLGSQTVENADDIDALEEDIPYR